ncbi:flavin-containing monooxygenase [Streptomyces sp. 4N509B]|uniref:flavin-containing monooxygenase n=1 Tax=Streptomyces sp. 4N509B TaxID=3457413 RepID=UPI003FD09265
MTAPARRRPTPGPADDASRAPSPPGEPRQPRGPGDAGDAGERVHVAVVGAGVAGLAVTACLLDRGVDVLAFDENADIAHTWRQRYDNLRLNSVRWFSQMPGQPIPRSCGRWVSRDDMVDYVTRYAGSVRHVVRSGSRVTAIRRGRASRWLLTTDAGLVAADHVVLATGLYHEPFVPPWPGRERFGGRLLHAADYRRPDPFEGERVLVVGAGVSGVDIATDLLRRSSGTLTVAVRTTPSFLPRELWGIPLQPLSVSNKHLPIRLQDLGGRIIQRLSAGDLADTPFGRPTEGMFSRLLRTGVSPSVDDGAFLAAVRAGRVRVVPGVAALEDGAAVTADGRRWEADTVIAATGYRTGLERLLTEPGALDERGVPPQYGPDNRRWAAQGLHFVGFTSPLTGHLREIGILARRVARTIHRARAGARTRAGAGSRKGDRAPLVG